MHIPHGPAVQCVRGEPRPSSRRDRRVQPRLDRLGGTCCLPVLSLCYTAAYITSPTSCSKRPSTANCSLRLLERVCATSDHAFGRDSKDIVFESVLPPSHTTYVPPQFLRRRISPGTLCGCRSLRLALRLEARLGTCPVRHAPQLYPDRVRDDQPRACCYPPYAGARADLAGWH